MKSIVLLHIVLILLCSAYLFGQETADKVELSDQSYNDQAVEHAEQDHHWQAIQKFEQALRTSGKQSRAAIENMKKFKSSVDLPSHSLLHFGWTNGIGKLAHMMFASFWFVLSVASTIAVMLLYFLSKRWSWKRAVGLLSLALICFTMSQLRSQYIQGSDLVIFKTDSDLKDKPYEASGEKQIVFEGQMARVEQRYEGFLLVQTDTYESGWVSEDDVVGVWENTAQ